MCSLNNMLLNLTRQEYPTANARSFRFPFTDGQREFGTFAGIRPDVKATSVDTAAVDKGSSWSEEAKGEKENSTLSKKATTTEEEGAEGEHDTKDGRNFTETFVAVIAQSILSVPSKRMTLSSIYNYIAKNYPHFDKEKGPGWRNSVRHNLSSNDCFVKASRAENGKGHYWMIHPKDMPEFSKGNFRRPRKPRRPRCNHAMSCNTERSILGLFPPYHSSSNKTNDLDFSSMVHNSSELFSHHYNPFGSRYPVESDSCGSFSPLMAGFSSAYAPSLYWQESSAFRNYTSMPAASYYPFLQMPPLNTTSPSRHENGGLKTV